MSLEILLATSSFFIAVFCAWWIALPLFTDSSQGDDPRHDRVFLRENAYEGLEDLEVEFRSGKIDEDEYRRARTLLIRDLSEASD